MERRRFAYCKCGRLQESESSLFLQKLSIIIHKINQDFVTPNPSFYVKAINEWPLIRDYYIKLNKAMDIHN